MRTIAANVNLKEQLSKLFKEQKKQFILIRDDAIYAFHNGNTFVWYELFPNHDNSKDDFTRSSELSLTGDIIYMFSNKTEVYKTIRSGGVSR